MEYEATVGVGDCMEKVRRGGASLLRQRWPTRLVLREQEEVRILK